MDLWRWKVEGIVRLRFKVKCGPTWSCVLFVQRLLCFLLPPEAPMCLEAASLGRMRLCIGLIGSSLNWREVKHVIQGFVRSAGSVVSLDFIALLLL